MFTGTPSELFKERFVNYLKDIYFMEYKFNEMLDLYAEGTKKFKEFPEYQEWFYKNVDTFKLDLKNIEERLTFYNVPRELPNEFPISFIPTVVNYFTTVKPFTFMEYVTNFYAFGQFKIGVYRLLTTMAYAYGDKETLKIAEHNLHDNIEAQRWIFKHMPEVCLYSLQYEKIPIPPFAWEFAKELELVGTYTWPTPR